MSVERFLVTGSSGCLGAWTVAALAASGTPVVALDIADDRRRLGLLAAAEQLDSVDFRQGDVTDAAALAELVRVEAITHIIHLAALQVPFCRADPVRGAQVNVVGTVNVLEAARQSRGGVRGLAYASSIAVFGPPERYQGGVVHDGSEAAPQTLYGAYKQANEATARIYAEDFGVPSVGLRPCVVYGQGRDQGLTSDVTTAIVAVLAGVPYRIAFGGGSVFQHAGDVAGLFIAAARARPDGAEILNVGGPSASVWDVIAAIEAAAPGSAGTLTHDPEPLPLPDRVDASGLNRLLGPVAYTPLTDGIAQSVAAFADLLERGLVQPPS